MKFIANLDVNQIDDIESLLRRFSLCEMSSDVISYLSDEIGIIQSITSSRSTIYLMINEAKFSELIKKVYPEWNVESFETSEYQDKADIAIFILEFISEERISEIIAQINSRTAISFLLPVRERLVLTPFWRKNTACPCPRCQIDYLCEKVFFNPIDVEQSLSEVMEYLISNGFGHLPAVTISSRDLLYILRYLQQKLDVLLGNATLSSTLSLDPHASIVFEVETLKKSEVRIPFSPRCDCINFHSNPQ